MTHYPVTNITVPSHAVSNNDSLLQVLADQSNPINGIMHGHIHRGRLDHVKIGQHNVTIFCAGSCAIKAGGFNVYTILDDEPKKSIKVGATFPLSRGLLTYQRYDWSEKEKDFVTKL